MKFRINLNRITISKYDRWYLNTKIGKIFEKKGRKKDAPNPQGPRSQPQGAIFLERQEIHQPRI